MYIHERQESLQNVASARRAPHFRAAHNPDGGDCTQSISSINSLLLVLVYKY